MKFIRKEDLANVLNMMCPGEEWVGEEEIRVVMDRYGSDSFWDREINNFVMPVRNKTL